MPRAEVESIKQKGADGIVHLKLPSLLRVEDELFYCIELVIIGDFVSHKLDEPYIEESYLEIHSVELHPVGSGIDEDNEGEVTQIIYSS